MISERVLHYSNILICRKDLRYSCRQWVEAIARSIVSRYGTVLFS